MVLNNQRSTEKKKKKNLGGNLKIPREDGRGIGWGGHVLSYKFIERKIER